MSIYNSLKDSIYNQKKSEHILRLQTEFETEARDLENKQLKEEQQHKDSHIRSQERFIYAISVGLVIAAILVWILFRQHKRILDVNKILSQKNVEIHKQNSEIESQAKQLRQLNEELQSLNKNLELRINERTQQLINQNKKLAAYAYANAHLLRAPVASILGLIDLLERVTLAPDDQALVLYLQKCAKELDAITKTLGKNLEEESL